MRLRFSFNAVAGGILVFAILVAAILGVTWTPHDPMKMNYVARLKPPSMTFLLGTDEFGRDMLSRLLAGASNSIYISLLAMSFAIVLGSALGVLSGFLRGWVDMAINAVVSALLAFPGILLALGILSAIGPSQYGIIIALGLAYTPSVVRIVRGDVLSLREREFVESSRSIGNSELYTMFRHILPNCVAPIIVLATSIAGWAILSESALSYLGLGVPPPAPTWGNMLSSARPYLGQATWLTILPGLCISLSLLGINLFGDALRDILDPRMRGIK